MTGMRESIEGARRQVQRTSDLATAASGARERVESYRDKGDGAAMTSFGRLRELEQERDLAEDRLRRAQSGGEVRPAPSEATAKAAAEDPLSMLELPEASGPDEWDRL